MLFVRERHGLADRHTAVQRHGLRERHASSHRIRDRHRRRHATSHRFTVGDAHVRCARCQHHDASWHIWRCTAIVTRAQWQCQSVCCGQVHDGPVRLLQRPTRHVLSGPGRDSATWRNAHGNNVWSNGSQHSAACRAGLPHKRRYVWLPCGKRQCGRHKRRSVCFQRISFDCVPHYHQPHAFFTSEWL